MRKLDKIEKFIDLDIFSDFDYLFSMISLRISLLDPTPVSVLWN